MGKQPYPINEVFAWIVDDATGQHAIMGFRGRDGHTIQAVSSRRDLMEGAGLVAEVEIAAELIGKPIRLQRFVLAETIKEFP